MKHRPPNGAGRLRTFYLAPWRVDVTMRTGVDRLVPFTGLARAVAAALDATGAEGPASIGLILTDDHELHALNRASMDVDAPTDVLAFPLLPPAAFPGHPGQDPTVREEPIRPFALPPRRRAHLGDVVVSVERAVEQAVAGRGGQAGDARWTPGEELRLLATHGTLHLCGWDHALPDEETAMRALERRLLGHR